MLESLWWLFGSPRVQAGWLARRASPQTRAPIQTCTNVCAKWVLLYLLLIPFFLFRIVSLSVSFSSFAHIAFLFLSFLAFLLHFIHFSFFFVLNTGSACMIILDCIIASASFHCVRFFFVLHFSFRSFVIIKIIFYMFAQGILPVCSRVFAQGTSCSRYLACSLILLSSFHFHAQGILPVCSSRL